MNRSLIVVCVVALLVLAVGRPSKGEWTFQGLGVLPGAESSKGYGLSADGRTVVGYSGSTLFRRQAFRWTAEDGMVGLGFPPGQSTRTSIAFAVSADGSVVVGECRTDRGQEAFRWTADGGMVPLGDLGDPMGEFGSEGWAVSADGSVVVGTAELRHEENTPYRWTETEGMVDLGYLPGAWGDGFGDGVSPDGSIVVGTSGHYQQPGSHQAYRWTETGGMVGLGYLSLTPGTTSGASAISADGRTVVGSALNADGHGEPFRWTEEDGMVGLGMLSRHTPNVARAVSADGSTVVGGDSGGAFIWDEAHGIRDVQDVLEVDGGLDLDDWYLQAVWGISDDGRTIAGWGNNYNAEPGSRKEAWIATIPEPTTITLVITALVLLLLLVRCKRNEISIRFFSTRPSC